MAWKLLFGSDFGLMSLLTIVVIIGIGAGFYLFLRKKIAEDDNRNHPG